MNDLFDIEDESDDDPNPRPAVALADALDWLPDNWSDFVAMRQKKGSRAPFTDAAKQGIIRKLKSYKALGYDLEAVIQESIENGWSGVFPPKNPKAEVIHKEGEYAREVLRKRPHPTIAETREYLAVLDKAKDDAIKGDEARRRADEIRARLGIRKRTA